MGKKTLETARAEARLHHTERALKAVILPRYNWYEGVAKLPGQHRALYLVDSVGGGLVVDVVRPAGCEPDVSVHPLDTVRAEAWRRVGEGLEDLAPLAQAYDWLARFRDEIIAGTHTLMRKVEIEG
jgi:hypothetical protein